MDITAKITPFWNRIPSFFLYGLRPNALILAGILFAASYVFGGPLINLVYYVVIIKYASEALQHTVQGDLSPPALSAEVINENFELPFKLFIVYLCYFYALSHLLGTVPSLLAIPLLIVAILLLPAVVISLVVTEEIGHALNPLNWIKIAFSIGWPYLIMFLFLMLFGLIKTEVFSTLITRIPVNFVMPFWLAVDAYFMFVMFHLMGYVTMQYHEELGGEAPEVLIDDTQHEDEYASPRLQRFIEEGNTTAAIGEISSMIQDNPQDLELRRRMYVFLMSNGENERLQRFAPHYFGMLTEQKRYEDAATVYHDSHERGDAFIPETTSHYLAIMQVLRRRRMGKQAVLLAQGFHKRFPNDPRTPEVYLEMAKILSEDLQRDELAKNTLAFLLKGFPDDVLIPEVKQFLGILSNLTNAAPAN
ncbi:MAG: hypothetical protein ABFS08_11505 [Pseudomonadota bacterium]